MDYSRQYNIYLSQGNSYTLPQDSFVFGTIELDSRTQKAFINNKKMIMMSASWIERDYFSYVAFAFAKKGDVIRYNDYASSGATFTIIPRVK